VVQVGSAMLPLWEAIDHVLIAGTSPTYVKMYLGSWLQNFDALGVAEALAPNVDFVTHKVWDSVYVTEPEVYWEFEWTWLQVFDAFADLSSVIDLIATDETGVPTEVYAYYPGLGDMAVEKWSALAEDVKGKIRRAEFELDHFNIINNDQVQTVYPDPSGVQVSVNPWQLLFVELGLPVTQIGCRIFTLSPAPSELIIRQRASGTSTITVKPVNGFTGTVSLSASGLPSGVTASFHPVSPSITNPASTSTTSILRLTASSTATTGTANVIVTGKSGTITQTTTISLTVRRRKD